jgi:hypothetical protein
MAIIVIISTATDFSINEDNIQYQQPYNFAPEFDLANWNFNNEEFPSNQEVLFKETFNKLAEVEDNNTLIDMLMGSIYYANQYSTNFLLESYNFNKFIEDPYFVNLLEQSIYQMEFIITPNVSITKDILVDYFNTLFSESADPDENEEIDYDY